MWPHELFNKGSPFERSSKQTEQPWLSIFSNIYHTCYELLEILLKYQFRLTMSGGWKFAVRWKSTANRIVITVPSRFDIKLMWFWRNFNSRTEWTHARAHTHIYSHFFIRYSHIAFTNTWTQDVNYICVAERRMWSNEQRTSSVRETVLPLQRAHVNNYWVRLTDGVRLTFI